jgi:hypothetical protein
LSKQHPAPNLNDDEVTRAIQESLRQQPEPGFRSNIGLFEGPVDLNNQNCNSYNSASKLNPSNDNFLPPINGVAESQNEKKKVDKLMEMGFSEE